MPESWGHLFLLYKPLTMPRSPSQKSLWLAVESVRQAHCSIRKMTTGMTQSFWRKPPEELSSPAEATHGQEGSAERGKWIFFPKDFLSLTRLWVLHTWRISARQVIAELCSGLGHARCHGAGLRPRSPGLTSRGREPGEPRLVPGPCCYPQTHHVLFLVSRERNASP